MSHSSYTASERRGILAIAILALLLIGGGVTLSLCGRPHEEVEEIPVVVEHPELVDSISIKSSASNSSQKSNKSTKSKTIKSSSKTKVKKVYRRRSPLDEPVS